LVKEISQFATVRLATAGGSTSTVGEAAVKGEKSLKFSQATA